MSTVAAPCAKCRRTVYLSADEPALCPVCSCPLVEMLDEHEATVVDLSHADDTPDEPKLDSSAGF